MAFASHSSRLRRRRSGQASSVARGPAQATSRAVVAAGIPLVLLGLLVLFLLEPCGVDPAIASRPRLRHHAVARSGLTLVDRVHKTFPSRRGHLRPALVVAGVANLVNLIVCNVLVRGDDFLVSSLASPVGLPQLGAFGACIAFSISSIVTVSHRRSREPRAPPRPGDGDDVRGARREAPACPSACSSSPRSPLRPLHCARRRFGPAAVRRTRSPSGSRASPSWGPSGSAALPLSASATPSARDGPQAGGAARSFMAACGVVFAAVPEGLGRAVHPQPGVVALGGSPSPSPRSSSSSTGYRSSRPAFFAALATCGSPSSRLSQRTGGLVSRLPWRLASRRRGRAASGGGSRAGSLRSPCSSSRASFGSHVRGSSRVCRPA